MAQQLQKLLPIFASGGTALLGLGGLGYGAYESVYTVDGGHKAVMFSRLTGVGNDVIGEGLHFRVPWFQYPVVYDVRAKPTRITSPTGTKDLQTVSISLRVLSRPMQDKLPDVYRNLGTDYDERVLPSIVNEVLKSVVARFNASQLITQRERVSVMIRQELESRGKEFWLLMEDVSITDLTFGREYTAAVEAKQVAQQNAQRAQLLVEKARQERLQKIVEAEGEAESAALIGKAVAQNPGYLNLQRIATARDIAHTVASSRNRVYLDAESLLLNVSQTEIDAEKLKKR